MLSPDLSDLLLISKDRFAVAALLEQLLTLRICGAVGDAGVTQWCRLDSGTGITGEDGNVHMVTVRVGHPPVIHQDHGQIEAKLSLKVGDRIRCSK